MTAGCTVRTVARCAETDVFPYAAPERRGDNLKGLKDFYLKPESGLDSLICAELAQKRVSRWGVRHLLVLYYSQA